ncbi:TNF receptor-associated factor 5 [Golovinomyces cichoracearum]|uniref:TNF receptor-associated factor 5 n=1 Tax=Golovinomyces cichoracearum TaxID=62708 RepID=A0A420IEM1_9PEZI|nr:TNF receptor-associated factor 5 [Golovinomyces cichoracearum]
MPRPTASRSFQSYRIENFSFDEFIESLSPTSQVSPGRTAPPNTPSSEFSKSPPRSSHSHIDLDLVHNVDLRAVTYKSPVEENLICAICRCAFINPITTSCQHTFCSECLNDALLHSPTCPIDRSLLNKELDLSQAPRIVQNQLDNLKVLCPCCQAPVSRSMISNHMSKYCQESLIRCPGIKTEKKCPLHIQRKLSHQGCLHYDTSCPDCGESLLQLDLPCHRENLCKARHCVCEKCGIDILRVQKNDHIKECTEAEACCRWEEYGCSHQCARKNLQAHIDCCNFRFFGKMAGGLRDEIDHLRSDVRILTETNQLQERRIKFLESGSRQFDRPIDYSDLSLQSFSVSPEAASTEPLNSGHEYLLSLLEHQESKLSQLSAGMTELEAKQTTMLFNETIPIKNELAEIRSLQQTASMHIRWLMAFRIRENSRRTGAGSGSNGEGSESPLVRRPSDSVSRDIITKL